MIIFLLYTKNLIVQMVTHNSFFLPGPGKQEVFRIMEQLVPVSKTEQWMELQTKPKSLIMSTAGMVF